MTGIIRTHLTLPLDPRLTGCLGGQSAWLKSLKLNCNVCMYACVCVNAAEFVQVKYIKLTPVALSFAPAAEVGLGVRKTETSRRYP